jgi:transposase
MAYRELTMIEVREVLRRLLAGQGLREVARETGLDRKTVRRYATVAKEVGFGQRTEVEDGVVEEVVHRVQTRPLPSPSEQRQSLAPHVEQLRSWLLDEKLRLTKAHELLVRRGVDVTYPTLRRFVIDELGWRLPKPTVRLEDTAPGEEAQIDFGHMATVDDRVTGKRRRLWALIVTLSFSRYVFVWPTFEQTTEAVIEGLDAAWRFFGGVPRRVILDNAKAMVVAAHNTAPRLQESFAEYAQARGFFADPARVRKPRDKARVENTVQYTRESCFAGETIVDLEHSREVAEHWCREVAGLRVHGTTRKVPREVFESEELAHMLAAPTEPFDVPRWSEAKVHPDHHIQVSRALYSVPTRYIGRTVRVRSDRATVRIYVGAELIKMHSRKAPGGRSTDPADYPSDKAAHALRSVDALRARAHKLGDHVGAYADALVGGRDPWMRMRQAYQLVRLCERYGAARVDALCKRSLEHDLVDVPRIDRMLRSTMRVEEAAERAGKLHVLPSAPRFARDTEVFVTRRTDPEGGAR